MSKFLAAAATASLLALSSSAALADSNYDYGSGRHHYSGDRYRDSASQRCARKAKSWVPLIAIGAGPGGTAMIGKLAAPQPRFAKNAVNFGPHDTGTTKSTRNVLLSVMTTTTLTRAITAGGIDLRF